MAAKLILLEGDSNTEYPLSRSNKIGRHPGNEVQVIDRIVSKEHATITQDERQRYILEDAGSLNGTYINGKRVISQVLKDGDTIAMGNTSFRFSEERIRRVSQPRRIRRKSWARHDELRNTAPPKEDSQLVRLAGSAHQSHIQSRLNAPFQFLPVEQIADVDTLRSDYEKLRIAHELSRSIAIHTNLDRLLQKIVDEALKLISAERAVILFYSDETGWMPRYTRQQSNELHLEIRLSSSILDEVRSNRRAVLSSDASCDERFKSSKSVIMEGIRSTMCVPLMVNDAFIGAFHVDSTITRNAFTEKDLQIFSGIANQASFAIENYRLAKKIEVEAQTRAQFERLVSPNLVDQIVEGEIQLDQGGQLKKVTMLFADIRGFTAMSESHMPQEMVRTLNAYFEAMVEVLFAHQGTLDKYVGDQIIGLFGAPVAMEDASDRAVQCAIAMLDRLDEFNAERRKNGKVPIEIGIGLNTGTVVAGAIGSSQTLQYTVIGDPVNVAARLCSAAGCGEILISQETRRDCTLDVPFRTREPISVKGKSCKIDIFEVPRPGQERSEAV